MAIKQLTVFVQNKKGTVVSVTDILSQNNVNIRALSIAETQEFGILRLIVNDEATAEKVLSENGYVKQAYDLLLEERVPSWLYSVQHGATTMWEHWNGIKEDGSFWSHNMNSFNHYAYGAVVDWMFGVSAGIKPTERGAGYKEISLMPKPDKRLGYSDAEIASVRGKIRSHWHYDGESVVYEFEIPRGTVAYLELPSGRREVLCGGKYRFEE